MGSNVKCYSTYLLALNKDCNNVTVTDDIIFMNDTFKLIKEHPSKGMDIWTWSFFHGETELNLQHDSLHLCSVRCEKKKKHLEVVLSNKAQRVTKHASGFKMPFHTNSLAHTQTESAWQERIRTNKKKCFQNTCWWWSKESFKPLKTQRLSV